MSCIVLGYGRDFRHGCYDGAGKGGRTVDGEGGCGWVKSVGVLGLRHGRDWGCILVIKVLLGVNHRKY
jgi:hypothetical protein